MAKRDILVTSSADLTFARVHESFSSSPLRASIEGANVILLPMMHSERDGEPVFGTMVRELYRTLNSDRAEGLRAEIAYEGDVPPTLVLHGELIIFGTLLLSHVLLPTVVGVLASMIHDYLGHRNQELDNSEVRCSLIVEHADGSAIRFDYQGPAAALEATINQATLPGNRSSVEEEQSPE